MEPATDPAALFDMGNKLLDQGQAEAAVLAFQRCLAVVPNHAGVRYNLGNALMKAGRIVEAAESLQSCLRLAPDFGAAYVNLGTALRQLALLGPAQAMAELGVQHLPAVAEAKIVLANVLHDKAEYAAAAALYRQVLGSTPNHAGTLSSLGNTFRAMGHFTEAMAAHDHAVSIDPDAAEMRFSRATALLEAGEFVQGWDDYEARWRRTEGRPRGFGDPWRGEDIAGRTILLYAEQGLGDTLQFVRYAPMVARRGARIVLEVQAPLVRLVQQSYRFAQVVARGDPLPAFDVNCPLLSLPRAFETRVETIPAQVPYLHADPRAVATWKAKLPDRGLRVGLVWAGSPHADNARSHLIDRRRSVHPDHLAPLGDIAGLHWISLQKDQPNEPPALKLLNPMPEMNDFADTAAVVANLDLIISVDTSVAHLAGALGRPVWLLSRYDGCWRWLRDRNDSPWYPGMRIYRQEQPHDWAPVIERIRSDLTDLSDVQQ